MIGHVRGWDYNCDQYAYPLLSLTTTFQAVNQIMIIKTQLKWLLQLNHCDPPLFCRFIVNSNPLLRKSWKINTSSRPEISHQHQMRYISSIFMICRNLATYKWNVFNVNIKIFSPVLTFSYQRCKFWARCRARYEANLAVFIVSFISNSIEYMWSILLLSFHLFSEMMSWI